jgi:hypothetical protein
MQKYVYFIKYFQLLERVLNILIFGFVGGFVGGLVSRFVGGLISGLVGRFVGGLVSGLVGGLVVVFGFAGVLDVSDESRVTIDVVSDGLTTTIGKNDEVFSLGVVSVAVLSVTEVQVGVVVLNSVVEVVVSRALLKRHYVKMDLESIRFRQLTYSSL